MTDPQEVYRQLSPAAFNGLGFVVQSSERSGRNHTTDEPILGQGTRTRLIVGDKDVWTITAVILNEEGPWADADTLINEFRLAHDYTRVGEYVDPYDGVLSVIPLSWEFQRRALDITTVAFRVTFARADLDTFVLSPGVVASTPDDVVEQLAELGEAMADEPEALAQMEAIRPVLGIDADVEGAEFTSQATQQLASGQTVATATIPGVITDLARAARTAALGEYTRAAYAALRGRIVVEAARSNSATLLDMREVLGLYLSSLGSSAFGTTIQLPQGRLSLLQSTRSLDELARLNRDAVNHWYIRSEARL